MSFMRVFGMLALALAFASLSGCGYHTLGAAAHLPASARTIAVPVFKTRTEAYHTETVLTSAVVRELESRTQLRIRPAESSDADMVLHGTILKEAVSALTYNASTQQSSSFALTIVAAVEVTDHAGKVLYKNDNYVYREQYQSTMDLPTFLEENPAAVNRLSRAFASQLVADVLESF